MKAFVPLSVSVTIGYAFVIMLDVFAKTDIGQLIWTAMMQPAASLYNL